MIGTRYLSAGLQCSLKMHSRQACAVTCRRVAGSNAAFLMPPGMKSCRTCFLARQPAGWVECSPFCRCNTAKPVTPACWWLFAGLCLAAFRQGKLAAPMTVPRQPAVLQCEQHRQVYTQTCNSHFCLCREAEYRGVRRAEANSSYLNTGAVANLYFGGVIGAHHFFDSQGPVFELADGAGLVHGKVLTKEAAPRQADDGGFGSVAELLLVAHGGQGARPAASKRERHKFAPTGSPTCLASACARVSSRAWSGGRLVVADAIAIRSASG